MNDCQICCCCEYGSFHSCVKAVSVEAGSYLADVVVVVTAATETENAETAVRMGADYPEFALARFNVVKKIVTSKVEIITAKVGINV